MLTRCICWMKDQDHERDGIEIEALDHEDAAQEACEQWEKRGSFAGDPYPDPIEVHVRDLNTRALFLVSVSPSWDVSFYSTGSAKQIDEPEPEES